MGPEEWRRPDVPAAAPAEKEAEARLEPRLHPRRPTPQEFSCYTPEKLELIDGHVLSDDWD
jgi:hypothetical protein